VLERVVEADEPPHAGVARRHEGDRVHPDPVHDPLGTVLDAGATVIAARLHEVADEEALLAHAHRKPRRIEFASTNASLLDLRVDGIRFAVRSAHQRDPLPVSVPLEEPVDHRRSRFVQAVDAADVAAILELRGDVQRMVRMARTAQLQREGRLLGIVEAAHRVELDGVFCRTSRTFCDSQVHAVGCTFKVPIRRPPGWVPACIAFWS
jgi:hypothetical protein